MVDRETKGPAENVSDTTHVEKIFGDYYNARAKDAFKSGNIVKAVRLRAMAKGDEPPVAAQAPPTISPKALGHYTALAEEAAEAAKNKDKKSEPFR